MKQFLSSYTCIRSTASLGFVTWNMLTSKPVFSPEVINMQSAGSAWAQSLGSSRGIRTAPCPSHTSQSLLGPEEKPKSATVGGCRQLGPTIGPLQVTEVTTTSLWVDRTLRWFLFVL